MTCEVAGFGPPVMLVHVQGDSSLAGPVQTLLTALQTNHMVVSVGLPALFTSPPPGAHPELTTRQLVDGLHRAAGFVRTKFNLGARHAVDVVAFGSACELVSRAAVEDPVRWGRFAYVGPTSLNGASQRRRQRLQRVRQALERRWMQAEMASASPQYYEALEQPVWLVHPTPTSAARFKPNPALLRRLNWRWPQPEGEPAPFQNTPPFVELAQHFLRQPPRDGANPKRATGSGFDSRFDSQLDSQLDSRFDARDLRTPAQPRAQGLVAQGQRAGAAVAAGAELSSATTAAAAAGGAASLPLAPQATVKVWDRFVRVFHWSLVLAFAVAYFSTTHVDWVHKGSGYATLALVAARVVWGFMGSNHARFASFVPGPKKLLLYLGAVLRQREPRHLGHNPAGAAMIVALLLAVVGIGVTGWMMTTDAFWGNGTVEDLHVGLVDVTLVAVAVHVVANIYGSWRHRENLILSMVTGRKPALRGDGKTG
jgi:cytochrome b